MGIYEGRAQLEVVVDRRLNAAGHQVGVVRGGSGRNLSVDSNYGVGDP